MLNSNARVRVNILFDNGSHLSYISPALQNKLNLSIIATRNITIKTFGSNSVSERLNQVNVSIAGVNHPNISVSCYDKDICEP